MNSSFQQPRNSQQPPDYNNRNRQYGSSLPSSPNRARSSNNPRGGQQYDTPADIIARRARSNDSLSARSDYNAQSNYPMNSPGSKATANPNLQQQYRNSKNYKSAPHLNQDMNIQDMTDDSDQE